MKNKEDIKDINKKLADVNSAFENALEQMTDSFALNSAGMPEYSEDSKMEGFPDYLELKQDTDVEKKN